jgi:outer membrane lipoprotein-sorting protein
VFLLGAETMDGRPSLAVQFVDGTSGTYHRLWVDPRNWRPIQHTAVSRGRTVTTKYSGFDQEIKIQPPKS